MGDNGGVSDAQTALIKQLVSEEVRRQMDTLIPREITPMRTTLDRLDRTVRSFYSNGSGGPPGALEIWRKEDQETFAELKESAKVSAANNDTFLKFISRYDEREARKKQLRQFLIKWGWKAAVAIAGGVFWLGSWTFHQVYPVIHAVWQEYEKNHPAVSREIESHRSQSTSEPMVSQSAHIPHL